MRIMVLMLIFLVLIFSSSFSQQLENYDLEQWSDNNHPIGWNTEIENEGIIIYTAEKTTDAYSGSYAALLETQRIITNDIVPGMLQLGRLNIDDLVPEGAVPFDGGRPTGIRVFIKYFPVEGDSLVAFAYLIKRNEQTNKVDTLGGAFFVYTEYTPEYQELLIPIYYVQDGDPDSINVGFFSSGFLPHEGSKLYLDKIELIYDTLNWAPYALPAKNQTDTSFDISWVGFANAKSYILDVAEDEEFLNFLPEYKNLNVGDTTEFHIKIPYRERNVYFYRVKAVYDSMESDYSNVIKVIIPWSTTAYEAQNITATSFTAIWDYQPECTHFMFQVATDSNFNDILPQYEYFPVDTNTVTVIGLEPEKDYYYRVAVRYGKLGSKWSNVVKVRTKKLTDLDKFTIYGYKDKFIIYIHESLFGNDLRVVDLSGKIVWNGTINTNLITIPIYGPSVYNIQVFTDEKVLYKKVIVGY